MSEILFIATDPSIVALIDNLQRLLGSRVALEPDFNSGVKRCFDSRPAVVFMQHTIGALCCEKVASQVKMLLEGEPIPLVLLSDEPAASYSVVSTFAVCFDLCLPLDELTGQVGEFLKTLPAISWKEPAAPPTPAVPEGNAVSGLAEGDAAVEEPPDFLADPFAFEPIPLEIEEPQPAPQRGISPPANQHDSLQDLHRIEKEVPSRLFGSMSEEAREPARPWRQGGSGQPAAGLGRGRHNARGAGETPAAPVRKPKEHRPQEPPPPSATATADQLPASVAARLGIRDAASGRPKPPRYRAAALCCLLGLLCLAAVSLALARHTDRSERIQAKQPVPLPGGSPAPAPAPAPALAELPSFIPPVSPEPGYAATHPGWESYRADGVAYLVYREKGSVRAVQVLSEQQGALTPAFLKTCLRIASGTDRFTVGATAERGGMQVTGGALQNGGELQVYRTLSQGEIRGFVITFPGVGQKPPL